MALADKDILITPNRGQSNDPKIEFKGADASSGPNTITLNVYPTDNGTLSFEGSAGQLFSITNSLTGTIFSVNDVSGIPSIEVLDTGLVKLAQYSGNVLLGTGTDNGTDKLQVNGSVSLETTNGTPLRISRFGDTGSTVIQQRNARGTPSSPTALLNGSAIGRNRFSGYDGSDYVNAAEITAFVDGAVSAGAVYGRFAFVTNGTDGYLERVRINSGGGVQIGGTFSGTNNGLGIGTTPGGVGTISMTGQLINSVAQGTAPFTVTSTTVVTNLNADLLDGNHASAFLSSATDSTQDGYFGNIYLYDDTNPSHYLSITNSSDLSAARTLSVNVNNEDRTISLSGNLTVSAAATVSGTNTGDQTSVTGSAGSVTNSVTFNNGGSGDASGTTYNGSAARTISYNTIGAASSGHGHYIGTTAVQSSSANQAVTGITSITGGTGTTDMTVTTAATAAATGILYLKTGDSTGTNTSSGAIAIASGTGNGSARGGIISISPGDGGSTSTTGGNVSITGGNALHTLAAATGGYVLIRGGGSIGTAPVDARGGHVYIAGGNASSNSGTKTGGNVYIDGGAPVAGGTVTNGQVYIGTGAGINNTNTSYITISQSAITTQINGTVKLPDVGTSGFVKLGANGQLSADTNTYLSSSTTSTQDGYFGNIYLYDDTNPSHYLAITNASDLSAARTLSVNVNNADRTISLSGNLTVSAAATVSGTNTGDQTSVSGSAGSVVNAVTFNNGGSGDASGTTYNGSAARTISYNTIGAASSEHGHFIGTTAVQSSSASQAVTGITSISSSTSITVGAGLGAFGGNITIIAGEGFDTNANGGNVSIKGGLANSTSNSAQGGSVYITGGVIETAGNTNYSGNVYIDGGGSYDIPSTTLGSVYIGTQTSNTDYGTSEVVIGKTGTSIKMPGLGTSGFIALGPAGELSTQAIDLNPRVVTGGSSGTLTINSDTTDVYNSLSISDAITIAQPSGTPVDGRKLIIRLRDDGTLRTITWTTSSGAFRALGTTLPTDTTTINKITYVGCIYNATDSFWDVIAVTTQE